MGAAAAVRGVFRTAPANISFRQTEAGEDGVPHYGRRAQVENIKNILSHAGYTMTRLSTDTARRYGSGSSYFIPPTFLYKLRSGVTPHLCQIAALSEITSYRFVDWMKVCGFDLDQIPRLQMRLHNERTVLVTPLEPYSDSCRSRSSIFYNPAFGSSLSSRQDAAWRSVLSSDTHGSDNRRYLFAKIGRADALVYSELMPGAIVRVDRCYRQRIHAQQASEYDPFWLVELPGGLSCSRIKWIDDRQIVLLPSRPPWGSLPLRLSTEARILGLVETERGQIRPYNLQHNSQTRSRRDPQINLTANPQHIARPPNYEHSFLSPCAGKKIKLSRLLRNSRRRTGLTFRAAHQITTVIAQILGGWEYAIGLGVLSDYETMVRLPRHIAKIISLCVTYCIDPRDLMEAAGVYIDDSAKIPLPAFDQLLPLLPEFADGAEDYRTIGIGERSEAAQVERISRI